MRERALLQEYQQAASAFQLLTETRFRLLALLPIGAGVGAVAVDTRVDDDAVKVAIALFGLAVTIALLTYNARNDQLYDTLVARLAHIERELTLPDGAFANRPGVWLRLFGVKVEHGWPVVTVYLACVAAWIFVSLSFIGAPAALVAAVIVVLVGPTVGVGGCVLEAGREISARHLRADEVLPRHADRLGFYVGGASPEVDAAQFVAAVTDVAPEWLYDCLTNRRGAVPQD